MAATTYSSSRVCLVQVPRHIRVTVGGARLVAKSHFLHPAVEQGSAPAYRGVVTCDISLGERNGL
jgi:hypothetical protein